MKPNLITFCDGNEDAFGVVVYALWTLQDGSKEARFLLAKAKLGPLLSKGEVVKTNYLGQYSLPELDVGLCRKLVLNSPDLITS